MKVKSLNQFLWLRSRIIRARNAWLRWKGVNLGANINLSLSAKLRPARKGSIVVGDETLIAFKTLIYSRDELTGQDRPVRIGRHCFIGGGSMILPGVTVGDECIVGAGAVVFESIPSRSIVIGNPARLLRGNIEVGAFGRLPSADAMSVLLWQANDEPKAQ
jgi:maltose O-acetyltransferase